MGSRELGYQSTPAPYKRTDFSLRLPQIPILTLKTLFAGVSWPRECVVRYADSRGGGEMGGVARRVVSASLRVTSHPPNSYPYHRTHRQRHARDASGC